LSLLGTLTANNDGPLASPQEKDDKDGGDRDEDGGGGVDIDPDKG
jgi:hypothetical protein